MCDAKSVDLTSTLTYSAAASAMVAEASKIDVTTHEVPEQKCSSTALDASPAIKRVYLDLPDKSKDVSIGADLSEK